MAYILDYSKETPTTKSDSKVKSGVDSVLASKFLMDHLAQKGPPAGMTAAMLATLAATATSSSGMSEQKRLLLELEKKVEEQKKLIEMQKVISSG